MGAVRRRRPPNRRCSVHRAASEPSSRSSSSRPARWSSGFLQPYSRKEEVKALRDRKITSFSVELIPRISRAQSMDALSSQAAIAGYKGVLIASMFLPKFFPMLTTAAGTIRPSQVLVIGAGVAGLQAIATARRLGAVVEAYDVRSATREQVKSLGAKFVETGVSADGAGGYARELTAEEKAKQQEVLDSRIAAADAVVSTAAVPGRPAPKIISRAAVERMRLGSVVVDLAAEQGGNCELTKANETVVHNGVSIIGPVNLPAQPRVQRERDVLAQSAQLPQARHRQGRAEDRLDRRSIRAVMPHA